MEIKAISPEEQRDPQTYAIIGAAMEVHRELEAGLLEAVYQEALAMELQARNIPFKREVMRPIRYKAMMLHSTYRADFVCYDEVIIESKAQNITTGVDQAQVFNYLKATGYRRAILLNFGKPSLDYTRLFLPNHEVRYHL